MIKLLYIPVITLLGAIIIHIVLLFTYPILKQETFWEEIEQIAQANQFSALPTQNAIVKLTDPIAHLRLCHFDLNDGPVHFYAQGDVPFWSLSIYDDKGSNLYSINSHTSPKQILDLIVGDPIQIIDYRQAIADKTKKPVLSQQNINKGFAILRVLRLSHDWNQNIETFLNHATCEKIDS